MKTPLDPRHIFRQKIVQALFERSFYNLISPVKKSLKLKFSPVLNDQQLQGKIKDILKKQDKIDIIIHDAAPEWPVEKINKVDLAILRLAIYEMIITKNVPVKVIVDEAVELAKEFGGDTSSRFVNGALGKAIKKVIK